MQSAALLAAPADSPAPPAAGGPRAYDPLLDSNCRVHSSPPGQSWQARWIWHPGQLAAHRHGAITRASMERCVDVGYPGAYRQAETITYFRRRAVLPSATPIRWSAPLGRVRLILNGNTTDITLRKAVLPAGAAEIVAVVDFTASLPCFILEGAGLGTGPGWEASLDRVDWVEAEADPAFTDPALLPDARRELRVDVPPARVVASRQASGAGASYSLEPGGDLILDFWHDELGALACEASGDGALSVAVGESLEEVQDLDPRHFEQRPLADIRLTGQPAALVLPERCVRYARFRTSGPCRISGLRLEAGVWPAKYRGSFQSCDPRLNAIWSAGAATMHANMHSFYLDGLRRDALPWHDSLLVLEAADCVFSDAEVTRQSILSETLPAKPGLGDMGLIDGQLYLLTGFESDYLTRGDVAFSRRYRDRIEDVLGLFLSLQDERGFVNGGRVEPYGFFPDWSATAATGPDGHATPAYAQMHLMRAFEIGSAFARRWDDAALAGRYAAAAAKLRRNIRELFWDPAEGAFINGLDSHGAPDRRFSTFAQVNGVLFDLAAPAEWGSMFDRVLNSPARRGPNFSIAQPWEFLAYAKAGRTDELLSRLRSVWGALIDAGYARFPEDIRVEDTRAEQLSFYKRPFGKSLCHAWAGAAPVLALARGVLGVWPTEGGYRECRIRPRLGGLQWVNGAVPVPAGVIRLEVDSRGARVALPEQVSATLSGYVAPGGTNRIVGPGTFELRPEAG